ncbi:MAG: nicotinate-nucleotide--dimethylbenzimidazole phosphoribosyltransferase [Colwellia sp.]|nr:nicotinate-nucleotide--dimethylbenzimidazole phosphoribosyltransferase [Colwellia sp.]
MNIAPLNRQFQQKIQEKINNKTKPVGSLGQLESLAVQLALIQSQNSDDLVDKINLAKPLMLIFAGDHGINDHGLSIAPSAVTGQMVMNFLHGGAAINCFCQVANIEINVIDCGILQSVEGEYNNLVQQRLGNGTNDFSQQAAMSLAQVEQGFLFGQQLVEKAIGQGRKVLLLGEMGIANTSAASAIFSALSPYSVEQCVGLGTGINSEQLSLKIKLISTALLRLTNNEKANQSEPDMVKQVLSEVGGFEIVQMVGTILAAANAKLPVIIDGFIVSIAAFAAMKINHNVGDFLIFSHVSQEQGHQLLLKEMDVTALLSLDLRLGEGTGGALALPLLQAAAGFYNDMASFESAGVTV